MSVLERFYSYFEVEKIIEKYNNKIQYNCTTGLDKINHKAFTNNLNTYAALINNKIQKGTYSFTKYIEVLMSKGKNKIPRVISQPSIKDKVALSLLHSFLDNEYKDEIDNSLIHSKIHDINENIQKFTHFIKIDISGFYSNIDHQILKEKLAEKLSEPILTILSKAIETPSVPRNFNAKITPINNLLKGVPEGLSISNILAEIYLINLDKYYKSIESLYYCRFVDDILILCNKNNCEHISREISDSLSEIKLSINLDKFKQGEINNERFNYLGYCFYRNKTGVRKTSLERFEFAIEKLFCDCRNNNTPDKLLEWKLNLKIAGCVYQNRKYGWLFYYSQINDIAILKHLDWYVKRMLSRFKHKNIAPKNFVKTYYEIKYNLHESNYFWSIDKLTDDDKLKLIIDIYGVTVSAKENVENIFQKTIKKDLLELEKDIQFFS